MNVLIPIGLKSLLIAGVALALLELMKRRSAAERSWVAHIGLLALIIVAFAPLVLPNWNVEAPALLGHARAPVEARVQTSAAAPIIVSSSLAPKSLPAVEVRPPTIMSGTAAVTALYAVPATILLLITLLALARLVALQARADVLVDAHWLSALARAQRRMGFKHGTALLTSNELASPISWGLMRPVIVLNDKAVQASGDAEAIIAHELAHVARMDWVKLLLARFATALFWFNPLVWLLAREAHQLREEAADDAVLETDIVDTDYAELLVGAARHDCPSLLLGAHGVAPSKSSLARRITRVLDSRSARGPAARTFALGVFTGAVLIAAPLAALNFTPAGSSKHEVPTFRRSGRLDLASSAESTTQAPTDLPHIIAGGVSASVQTVAAVTSLRDAKEQQNNRAYAAAEAVEKAQNSLRKAQDAREEALARAAEATGRAQAALRKASSSRQIDQLIELKTLGISPQYIQDLAAAGLRNLGTNEIAEAHSIGLTGDYVRAVAAAGVPLSLDDYVELRSSGVPIQYIISIRKSGHAVRDPHKIIEMWSVRVNPDDLRVVPPQPPIPPKTPRMGQPAAAPPDWNDPSGG